MCISLWSMISLAFLQLKYTITNMTICHSMNLLPIRAMMTMEMICLEWTQSLLRWTLVVVLLREHRLH
uniref:Uncharacterized protein n=1 Tax=Brassica oleracea TaxID=3712 RepID=A0A3P6DCR8_BRAOL|nr:unnamed protein product [Brassica oleracea]